jgi:hypothetical protein
MPNKITIPSEFKLNGKKIIVQYDDEYCDENGLLGEADFTDKTITLTSTDNGKRLPRAEIHKTFYHELTHLVLDAANRHQLKYNEEFVDAVGMLLYEYERTKKY